jgi:hypothetical protein
MPRKSRKGKSSNNGPKRGGSGRGNKRTTLKGESALQSIYRFSKDQAIKAIKNRYMGPMGTTNVAKDVSFLMGIVNTEDKHVDLVQTFASVTTGVQQIIAIGTCNQGTTVGTRIGDSIKVCRIDLQLQFQFSTGTLATTAVGTQQFRYWLLRYLKTPSTNGTVAFAISEFLNQDSAGNYSMQSLPNAETNENFQIMDTGEVSLQLISPYASPVTMEKSLLLRKECSFHQTYSGAANTTIVDNMVWFVVVSADNANTGGLSGFLLSQRTWYVDN